MEKINRGGSGVGMGAGIWKTNNRNEGTGVKP